MPFHWPWSCRSRLRPIFIGCAPTWANILQTTLLHHPDAVTVSFHHEICSYFIQKRHQVECTPQWYCVSFSLSLLCPFGPRPFPSLCQPSRVIPLSTTSSRFLRANCLYPKGRVVYITIKQALSVSETPAGHDNTRNATLMLPTNIRRMPPG